MVEATVDAQMSTVKKQHYVPQFYLRHFAASSDAIYVYDKPLNKSFRSSISDVAQDKYFYDVKELDAQTGIDQFIEKFFHPTESEAAVIFAELIDQLKGGRFCRLSDEQRGKLSVFLALQYLRTLESRNRIIEMMEKLYDAVFRLHLQTKHPDLANQEFTVKVDDTKRSRVHAAHVLNSDLIDELAQILYNHRWFVLVNTSSTKYYTSDCPLVTHAHYKHPYFRMSGLKSKGIEIFLPISPEYAIDIVERTFFADLSWKDSESIRVRNSRFAEFHNSLQVIHSTRQVFSHTDDFRLAKEMCKDYRELTDPQRSRVVVS